MKRHFSYLFLILILTACSKPSHPDYYGTIKPRHPADELWIDIASEPQYMDAAKIADSVSHAVVANLFLRLTQIHPITQEPVPDLAKSWNISKDGKEYTFHIRKDAVWSDGQPVTAHDVEYSWKRLLEPSTAAQYGMMADVIENAREFREQSIQITGLTNTDSKSLQAKLQKTVPVQEVKLVPSLQSFFVFVESNEEKPELKKEYTDKLIDQIQKGLLGANVRAQKATSDIVQVKAKDDHTFWVKLEKPIPYFLGLIEYIVFAPLPQHVIEKFKAGGKEDQWTRAGNIVVSGPFQLVEEEFKQYKIFEKNPKYFNASKVRLKRIKTNMTEDYSANLNAYKAGQHAWCSETSIPPDMLDILRKYKDFHFDPQMGVYYYQFNTKRKPFVDVKVRHALSLAIDRQKIVNNITKQGQAPATGLVPPMPGYKGLGKELYNPELAKKLLAEAGFPEGKGFPKILIKFNTSDSHKKIAEAIQQMWRSTLGIQVDIANMEWRSMLQDQIQKNFDIMRMAWIADYADPTTFLMIFQSESGNNHTSWINRQYDKLISDADMLMDPKARFAKLLSAEKILLDDMPMTPVYFYTRAYMKKPYLKGFWPQYQDHHPWKYFWIDERWYNEVPTTELSDEPWVE